MAESTTDPSDRNRPRGGLAAGDGVREKVRKSAPPAIPGHEAKSCNDDRGDTFIVPDHYQMCPLGDKPSKVSPTHRKPYAEQPFTPGQAEQAREWAATLLQSIPRDQDARPAIAEKAKNLVEFQVGKSELAAKLIDAGLDKAGPFMIASREHPLGRLVEAVTKDYNAAHPGANLQVPTVAVGEKLPTAFSGLDVLALSNDHARLGDKVLKPVVAHELAHKHQIRQGRFNTYNYSVDAHLEHFAPGVREACAKAGLTPEQIRLALPSERFGAFVGGALVPSGLRTTVQAAGDVLDGLASPMQTLVARGKAEADPACKRETERLRDSVPQVIDRIDVAYKESTRGLEFDADRKAAQVYGNQAMAEALAHITKGKADRLINDTDHDHPSLQTRLKALGCTLSTSRKDVDTVTCKSVPGLKGTERLR